MRTTDQTFDTATAHPNVAIDRPTLRRNPAPLLRVAACLLLGVASTSYAQSPFSQPPSRSGAFTLPDPPVGSRTGPGIGRMEGARIQANPGLLPLPSATESQSPANLNGSSTNLPAIPGETAPLTGTKTTLEPRELPPAPTVMPPLSNDGTGPVPRSAPLVLKSGLTATIRVCQFLPADGFTSGERLLNGKPAIQPGDCFLAEVIHPCPPYPILVGGTVTEITEPRRFGKPGYVSIKMTQLVYEQEGSAGYAPWRMELADRRFSTRMRRVLLTALLGLEGAGTGASIGAQFSGGNMAFIGGGMGIGTLVGLGYASFQRGTEANLEPGDTFEVVVGTTQFRPIAREWQTILYPAQDPSTRKKHHK